MKRRTLLEGFIALATLPFISSCSRELSAEEERSTKIKIDPITVTPLKKPHEEWRSLVSPEAYRVLFEEDTERPESSPLNKEHRDGTYICAACYLPLFESEHKYESGTGWPSFTQPIAGHTGTKRDFMLIWPRTEYHCARCGGHQGHVFNDGPPPRGERWCNNGLALRFIPKEEALPELRG
ncbi:peptide-methionine (R)-S-oxide reductase MsrB [Nitrosomonas sp. Nm58]|uniref:peptide-methionine (R)-S-oxide reductase MsrB n=1 Tax=Nitrosomonas sp. Nm58 TaxID=200126 RepID=UPI000897B8BB|nr:peptide-methionine (R)-S-oxide reductase MsrB [Nitrosomonas sp. Nm58]SDY00767.1 peptide-methionine (R)-S-oxide reductase [Nitrosomonas sp. Nm58]